MTQLQIIAHRGSSGVCHENTMAAFERAIADGADGIEFDVRLTRDNEWVVYHDPEITVDGHPTRVREMTMHEIGRQRVGPARDSIPRLDDFLGWVRDKRIPVVFDIKDPDGVESLVPQVERAGLDSPMLFSSFHRTVLKSLEHLQPGWPRGLIVADPHSALARRFLLGSMLRWARRHSLTSLHFEEHWVTPSLVAAMKKANLSLAVWTVDDPLRIALLSALGVDAVITNQPNVALQSVSSQKK
jgi:glycerophosphoryl diester phosphodiesterase